LAPGTEVFDVACAGPRWKSRRWTAHYAGRFRNGGFLDYILAERGKRLRRVAPCAAAVVRRCKSEKPKPGSSWGENGPSGAFAEQRKNIAGEGRSTAELEEGQAGVGSRATRYEHHDASWASLTPGGHAVPSRRKVLIANLQEHALRPQAIRRVAIFGSRSAGFGRCATLPPLNAPHSRAGGR